MNSRNWKLDYLKGIACIIVVFLHCPFPGILGELIIYALRFSVPIFFMITGYYCNLKDSDRIKKKAQQLLKMILITEFFYFIWYMIRECLIGSNEINSALSSVSFTNHPVRTVFCGTLFNSTLWYLYAALWTYLIFLLFRKIHLFEHPAICMGIALFLICVQVQGRFYIQNHYDIDNCVFLFRNALTFGLPMTLTGWLIGKYEPKIKRYLSLKGNLLLLFAGFFLVVTEYFIDRQYMDFHFSTLVISVSLFAFSITYNKPWFPLKKSISFIGRELSMWIYLIHYFFVSLWDAIANSIFPEQITSMPLPGYIRPLVVCGSSIAAAALIRSVKKRRTS